MLDFDMKKSKVVKYMCLYIKFYVIHTSAEIKSMKYIGFPIIDPISAFLLLDTFRNFFKNNWKSIYCFIQS